MKQFLEIITKPDNVAIVIMMVAVIACSVAAFVEIRANDRLIKEGKKDEIYKRMCP